MNNQGTNLQYIDPEKIAEFLSVDPALLAELIELLLKEYPRRMQQLAEAIQQKDGKALERAAHSLRGAVSYFCRTNILERMRALETNGRELDFGGALSRCQQLEAAFPLLRQELESHMPAVEGGRAQAPTAAKEQEPVQAQAPTQMWAGA